MEFCGRQEIGLRGHRDKNATSSFTNGKFRELLEFRANSGYNRLRKRLDGGKKNAKLYFGIYEGIYTKSFFSIYEETASQLYKSFFGIQIDRFCKHWAAGNYFAICIWGKTKRKVI